MASDETLTLARTANYGDEEEGGVHLLHELKEEVLCRLPVKTLLRFRTVCKSWKTLIDSNHFKKKHYQFQSQHQQRLIWRHSSSSNRYPTLYTLSPQSQALFPLDLGSSSSLYPYGVVNGLIYFAYGSYHGICNPATKKLLKIIHNPPLEDWCYKLMDKRLPHIDSVVSDSFCAFGFDPKAEDYKFMMGIFVRDIKGLIGPKVLLTVYSLRRDSWGEDVVDAPAARGLLNCSYTAAFLNGKAYWYARKSGHEEKNRSLPGILEFDYSNESFKTTVLPVDLAGAMYGAPATLDGGSLGLIVTFGEIKEANRRCEIWVMEAGGGENRSWTKKLTCSLDPGVGWPLLMPVSWKEGREILATRRDGNQYELMLVDPAIGSCKILSTGGFEFKAFAYTESLFSI